MYAVPLSISVFVVLPLVVLLLAADVCTHTSNAAVVQPTYSAAAAAATERGVVYSSVALRTARASGAVFVS